MCTPAKPNVAAILAFISAISTASPAVAQNIGMAAHVGTLGLGADVALSLTPKVAARASANFFPFDINFESSGIDYVLEWASPVFLLLGDFYPIGGLRLSGGLMISSADYKVTGELAEPVEFAGTLYTPEEVGTLTGTLTTRDVSPYLGIGFGNPTASRIGFFVEVGVGFHGNPEVGAEADGPVSALPGFQQDLEAEVQEVQDEVENIIVYPVLSIGVSFRLGP